MATSFPSGLDAFTNPSSADTLDNPPHDQQHADVNDAVEALQAKVGVDGSADTSSLDYKVTYPSLPACVLPATTVSVPHATLAIPLFATEDYDPLGWHSTSVNTGRITPTIAGYYVTTAQVQQINGPGANFRAYLSINKNGSTSIARFDINNYAPDDFCVVGMTYMNGSSDYLETQVVQYSGGTKTPTVAFSCVLVAR